MPAERVIRITAAAVGAPIATMILVFGMFMDMRSYDRAGSMERTATLDTVISHTLRRLA